MNKKKIFSALNNSSKQKIGVIGDLMLDIFIIGDVESISPEAPIPVVKVREEFFKPGGSANVAMNIKNLGSNVDLVSVIGADYRGELLLDLLRKSKIVRKIRQRHLNRS